MSIVEKAVEKLKTLQPQEPVRRRIEPAFEPPASSASPVPTVERMQDRVRVMHAAIEATPVWHVNPADLKRAGLLPAEDEAAHRLADELRRIKRPLLANITGKGVKAVVNGQRIMVASAIPGEGKTFTSFNLAMSLARELDFEVLLVDGDIPKSDITRILKLDSRPGLMDVLADERRQPSEVIVRTEVPNLLVVPVGQRSPLAAEFFGSRRMEYVLHEFAGQGQRRLMLFDSSPLLATSEAPILASHMGQIIVVVAAGSTGQQTVKSALQTLDSSKCISFILNMSRLPSSEGYYDSYYHHYSKDR
ncbi:MAG: AAA family ATPase [Gammaproteobacteria bacterium]